MTSIKLDTVTNIIVILTCVIVSATVAGRVWRGDNSAHTHGQPSLPKPGTQMPAVERIDYNVSEGTILLFVRSTCGFCTESMPFYRKLAHELEQSGRRIRFVVLSNEPRDVIQSYLDAHRLKPDSIATVNIRELGLNVTPTLLLVDRSGSLRQGWMGRLTVDEEQEVLEVYRKAN